MLEEKVYLNEDKQEVLEYYYVYLDAVQTSIFNPVAEMIAENYAKKFELDEVQAYQDRLHYKLHRQDYQHLKKQK